MNSLYPNNILQSATENPKILFGIQDNLECTVKSQRQIDRQY